jgi:hypothetical protein
LRDFQGCPGNFEVPCTTCLASPQSSRVLVAVAKAIDQHIETGIEKVTVELTRR